MPVTTLNFPDLSFVVVDDDPDSLNATKNFLEVAGAKEIHPCMSSRTALTLLADEDEKVDCVVSKYVMTPVSGLQLLQHIRDGRNTGMVRDTRFVLITPHTESAVVNAAIALDVDGFAVRPVSQKKFMQVLTRALARKRIIKAASQYSAVELPSIK